MWTRLGLTLLVALGGWVFYSPPDAQAECRIVGSTPTYTAGQLKDLTCDPSGKLQTDASGTNTFTAIANASAPTHVEAAASSLWVDLSGLLHIAVDAFNVLLAGEDQTNQLLATSGGPVRITSLGSVTSATTSAIGTVPTGSKTFMGQIINATSETKAITVTIYGNWTSLTTGGLPLCTITLPSTVTVLQLQDSCEPITANYPFYFYTVSVYTSASAAPFTIYAHH